MTICETLPPIGMDVLFQYDKWISSFNPKGVRIGYFSRGGFILNGGSLYLCLYGYFVVVCFILVFIGIKIRVVC